YQWKDFYEPEIRKRPIAVSDELLSKCEGVYLFEDKYFVILKEADGGHLWSDWLDSKMYFTSEKEFYNGDSPTRKELMMDASGNVTGFKRFLNGEEIATAIKVTNADSAKLGLSQLAAVAWYLLENKRYDKALDYYKRSLALDPNDLMTRC